MKTVVVHVNDPHDVYIGRPSVFGNPFKVGVDGTREEVIAKHAKWVYTQPDLMERIKSELKGKRIACWCAPKRCHGDILAHIANYDDIFGD